jgi:hypothetical protein
VLLVRAASASDVVHSSSRQSLQDRQHCLKVVNIVLSLADLLAYCAGKALRALQHIKPVNIVVYNVLRLCIRVHAVVCSNVQRVSAVCYKRSIVNRHANNCMHLCSRTASVLHSAVMQNNTGCIRSDMCYQQQM